MDPRISTIQSIQNFPQQRSAPPTSPQSFRPATVEPAMTRPVALQNYQAGSPSSRSGRSHFSPGLPYRRNYPEARSLDIQEIPREEMEKIMQNRPGASRERKEGSQPPQLPPVGQVKNPIFQPPSRLPLVAAAVPRPLSDPLRNPTAPQVPANSSQPPRISDPENDLAQSRRRPAPPASQKIQTKASEIPQKPQSQKPSSSASSEGLPITAAALAARQAETTAASPAPQIPSPSAFSSPNLAVPVSLNTPVPAGEFGPVLAADSIDLSDPSRGSLMDDGELDNALLSIDPDALRNEIRSKETQTAVRELKREKKRKRLAKPADRKMKRARGGHDKKIRRRSSESSSSSDSSSSEYSSSSEDFSSDSESSEILKARGAGRSEKKKTDEIYNLIMETAKNVTSQIAAQPRASRSSPVRAPEISSMSSRDLADLRSSHHQLHTEISTLRALLERQQAQLAELSERQRINEQGRLKAAEAAKASAEAAEKAAKKRAKRLAEAEDQSSAGISLDKQNKLMATQIDELARAVNKTHERVCSGEVQDEQFIKLLREIRDSQTRLAEGLEGLSGASAQAIQGQQQFQRILKEGEEKISQTVDERIQRLEVFIERIVVALGRRVEEFAESFRPPVDRSASAPMENRLIVRSSDRQSQLRSMLAARTEETLNLLRSLGPGASSVLRQIFPLMALANFQPEESARREILIRQGQEDEQSESKQEPTQPFQQQQQQQKPEAAEEKNSPPQGIC